MRTSTLKKQSMIQQEAFEGVQYARKWRIAREAEAACHLTGNINGPDLDIFDIRDGKKISSDFA